MRARRVMLAALTVAVTSCGDDGTAGLPAISIPALGDGGALDLGALDGPAVVNFWATWCEPCLRELPDFQSASEDFPDVRFVGVDATGFGESAESVDFLAELGVTYGQFVDPDGEFSAEVEVTELPATLIIDSAGEIAWRHQGQVTYEELVDRLNDL